MRSAMSAIGQRTSLVALHASAFDPKRTLAPSLNEPCLSRYDALS
jgi:hypothetical protein